MTLPIAKSRVARIEPSDCELVRMLRQTCTGILETRDIVVTQRVTAHLHTVLLPFLFHAFDGTSSMQNVERELGRLRLVRGYAKN